ncbi:hypothetical protein D3C78_1007040 [compost metagenome]
MVGKGIFGFGDKSRKTLPPVTLPEGPVPAREHISPVCRRIIFSRISNYERLQIGPVGEKNTGISGAERMQSLR